jgi:hypothetical protein|tara:strand:- start:217 stop:447 length:231 start_codon:yes stop_codon:yes gene_type:complete
MKRAKFKAPCDLVLESIEDAEARALAEELFFYTMNTRGGAPTEAARFLARQTVEQLRARKIAMERQLAFDRGEVPA